MRLSALVLFTVLCGINVSPALAVMSASDIDKRAECMAKLTPGQKDSWKALLTFVSFPSGMPVRVQGGGHVCLPYKQEDIDAIVSQRTKAMSSMMKFCGVSLERLEIGEGKVLMQSYWDKALSQSSEFRSIFQQSDAAAQLCP